LTAFIDYQEFLLLAILKEQDNLYSINFKDKDVFLMDLTITNSHPRSKYPHGKDCHPPSWTQQISPRERLSSIFIYTADIPMGKTVPYPDSP
jgi:hypothetical protein